MELKSYQVAALEALSHRMASYADWSKAREANRTRTISALVALAATSAVPVTTSATIPRAHRRLWH